MEKSGYNGDLSDYSDLKLEKDLQRLEAEHHLYEFFNDFLSGSNGVEVDSEDKLIYLEAEADILVDDFVREYGDRFLDVNPELTSANQEFYRKQPDELYNELVQEMVREYISKGEYFEAEFEADTEISQDAGNSSSILQSAGKTVLAGGLVMGSMLGMAAAESTGDDIPIEYEEVEMARYSEDMAREDTDGDGLPDSYEELVLSNADPEQKDIFVEVDYSSTCDIDEDFFEEIEEVYADAPAENPDGTEGINLHMVVDDELEINESVDFMEQDGRVNDRPEIMDENFDSDGYGVHYMLLVDNATHKSEDVLGTATQGSMVVECGDRPDRKVLHTAIHELGHSMGLFHDNFKGVDTKEIPFEKYPSVMNYNDPEGEEVVLRYSNGTNSDQDFDDWSYIEQNYHTPEINLGHNSEEE